MISYLIKSMRIMFKKFTVYKNMAFPYWQHETSIASVKTISIRGDISIPRKVYDQYLHGFLQKYKDKVSSLDRTDVIHPCKDREEYCTIVKLNMTYAECIEYGDHNDSPVIPYSVESCVMM